MKITKFEITQYRSLIDFKIVEFEPTTIFYGENNAGKSNVLNALNTIFKRKEKAIDEGGFTDPENFYEGILPHFSNNFHNNDFSKPITFNVELSVRLNQLDIDNSIKSLISGSGEEVFTIEGAIQSIKTDTDFAEMGVKSILFNGTEIYSNSPVVFFATLDAPKAKQGQFSQIFTRLIDPINDCVHIINSDRDMHSTDFRSQGVKDISPQNFKNFLYALYLSPREHQVFESINQAFNSSPFNFGEISFANDNDKLEIMVKKGSVRLPIKHIGSGVLQTLYILSSIIYNKSKIICIEELEQNLSPKKQFEALRKIQAIITESQTNINSLDQIIISSHSSVYAKPKLGAIYLLEKVKDITTISAKLVKQVPIKALNEHLAPTYFEYSDDDHQEMIEFLKKEQDFRD
jgi:AAA15 family ATPase/GTPase